MFQWLVNMVRPYKPGYYTCHAPMCSKQVYRTAAQIKESWRLNKGVVVVLCPEHLERMTAGRLSDNNPKTNPDLESSNGDR